MAKTNLVLKAWQTLSARPAGKWAFSRAIALKAPYFASIQPRFEQLEVGYCEVTARKRRAVQNHIGTFHAIAMCNMAEVAGGIVTEVTLPTTHRWIPKGMTVRYLQKATTDLRAVAKIDPATVYGDAAELPVPVEVFDTRGEKVFDAVITMWVSPKQKAAKAPAKKKTKPAVA